jgi:hypothetical protein
MPAKGHSKYKERPCITCGKLLTPRQKWSGGKYCSLDCREIPGRPQRGKIDYICKHCGKHFQDRRHGQRQGRIYCSTRCKNLALPGNRTFVDKLGYVVYCRDGQRALQHRRVMETMLGRKLLKHETVHHKNGIRNDNRPENLELWSGRHGRGQRVSDLKHHIQDTACPIRGAVLSLGC